jgi:hypothetical protein
MFQLRKANRAGRRDDRGIAVVAAIGVAFILMVILTIVVAVTVATTNNSARDRVRTASIHSAEGALDTTLAEMERDTVCGAPSFSPLAVGEGAQQTIVTVTIKYYADDNYQTEVSCISGALAASATYAIVTATAVPTHAVSALQPSRTIEARLAVKSRGEMASVPGLYAAKEMYLVGTPDFFSPDPSNSPDIWVDTGKLYCQPTTNRQLEIEADVVVGQGGADLQEWCWFLKDVFVGGDMKWGQSTASDTSQVNLRCNNKFICGDLNVRGSLSIAASPTEKLTTGGNVNLGGTITLNRTRLVADGAVTEHATIAAKEVRGFPTVEYNPGNWANAPYFMTTGTVAQFQSLLNYKSYQQCTGTGTKRVCVTKWYSAANLANCTFDSQYYDSTIHLSSVATVYDMRDCAGGGTRTVSDVMKFLSTNTIEVNADTTFIVSGFFNSGTLNFVRGPTATHSRVWIIVTDEGVPAWSGTPVTCTAATLYNLCSTNILTTTADTPIMWYTKHLFYSDGKNNAVNDMYGQVFAGTVYFKGYLDLQFETLPIPGEILWTAGEPGFNVQLLSKRELPTE